MKMKRAWKKILLGVFATVMFVSLFTFIDMGWNVMEVKAQTYHPKNIKKGDILKSGDKLQTINDEDPLNIIVSFSEQISGTYFGKDITLPLLPNNKCYFRVSDWAESNQYDIGFVLVDHSYNLANATCTEDKRCNNCGIVGEGKKGHSYKTPTYIWSADNKSCTATRECSRDLSHKETQTVTATKVLKTPATCATRGTNTYTATFTNTEFSKQTKDVQDIDTIPHEFSYTKSGSTGSMITAKCSNEACSYHEDGISIALTADDATYTGSAYTGASIGDWLVSGTVLSGTVLGLAEKPTVITYKNQEGTAAYNDTTAPTNVGNYTASITVDTATATKYFKITKKNIATDDVTINRDNATYDGSPKSAVVKKKDGVDGMGGDITVKYQKKNGSDWDAETEEAPINAGTYNVIAYIPGGNNFNESYVAVQQFTIAKAPTEITTVPTFNNTISYGTTLNDISLGDDGVAEYNGNVIPGTFAWKNGTTKPVVSDTDTTNFTIEFTPDDSENYNPCETNVKLTIEKAKPSAPNPGDGYILNYADETLVADPYVDFEVSSTNGENPEPLPGDKIDPIIPGEIYYVRYKKNDNQEESGWTPIKVAPRPAKPADSDVVERTDVSITMQMIPGVEYSIDGTNWFTATDEANNVTVSDGKITFGGLTKETKYTIRSRVKATDSAPHGEETTQEVTTKKAFPASDEERMALFDITLPTGEDLIYDKKTKKAEVKLKDDDTGIGEPVIKYYKKNGDIEVEVKNPTDAGEYIVKVTTLPTDDYPALSPELKLGSFTIEKKEITISGIKANDKVYDGGATATLDYSNVAYDGIVSGDILFVSANGTFEAKEGKEAKDAGIDKTVAISDLALAGVDSVNYKLSDSGKQVSATASITPRELTEAMVLLTNKKFKETGSQIDVTAGENLLVKYIGKLTKGTDYVLSGDIEKTAVGSYTLKVKGIGNFQGTITRNWQITEKTVVSGISTFPEGPTIPVKYGKTPTITIKGTQPDDETTYGASENDISKESLEDVIKNFKDVGEYVIWYKVSRENHEPYEASIVLKIEPKELTVDDIVWVDESLEYNGKVQARAAKVKPESLISGDPCDVITTSTARNVGTGYTATATGLTNENYKLPEIAPTAPFSITPKSLTLKARNVSKYVGEKDPTLSYEAVGLCPGDIISGVSVSRNPGEGAGTYLIKVTVDADAVDPDAANKNYTITTQYGSLVIKERPSDNEDSNGGSGNNNPVIPVVPVQKPVVLPIDALTANATNKNTKNKAGNNKGANLGADGANAETDDSLGANGAGNLTLHLEVSEHSPIETASIETPVTKLVEGSDVFTTEEALAIKGGVDARVWVHIDKLDMSVVSDSVHDEILSAAKDLEDDNVELLYFDISLFKQIGDGEIVNIHEPGTHIDITLELPESVINTDDKVVREYKILRLHDGVIDVIPTTYNPDTQTISFATDKFSTYVLAYIDKSAEEITEADNTDSITVNEVEKENSSTAIYIILFILLILAIAIIIFILYRRKKNEDTI